MRRSGVLYLGMVVVLVVGLWGIIAAGSQLRAPYDISGAWTVWPEGNPAASQEMRISQSGMFVQIQSDALGRLHLQLPEDAVNPEGGEVLRLQGSRPITIRIPSGVSVEHQFQVDGTTYIGKRIPAPAAGGSQRHG